MVMEGGEGLVGREQGGGLRLGDRSASLSFTVLKGNGKESCFVLVIHKCFLTYSCDLPIVCLFFFHVC